MIVSCVAIIYLYDALNVYFYHVTYTFKSESTLCNILNVKETLARKR